MSAKPSAVILAAGRGNRLLPLTEHIPKCLLEIDGKSILEHQLQAIRKAGVENIQIVTGHGAEHVRERANSLASYAHNARFDQTNSFDSLGCMDLQIGPEGLLILNSDVLFHPDLLMKVIEDPRENVLLADFSDDVGEEEMKIITDKENRITRISKAIDPKDSHAENLGVLRLSETAANRMLELSRKRDDEPKIAWVPDGIQFLLDEFAFHALSIEGLPWTEIDYVHDLQRARETIYPQIRCALWDHRA